MALTDEIWLSLDFYIQNKVNDDIITCLDYYQKASTKTSFRPPSLDDFFNYGTDKARV